MRAPRQIPLLLAAIVLASAAASEAQTTYTKSTFTQGMTALTSPTVIWPAASNTYSMSTFAQGMTPLTSGTVCWDSANGNYYNTLVFVNLPSGLSFNYYGTTYTQIYITTLGYMCFSAGSGNRVIANAAIPATTVPDRFVAPFWDDLYMYQGGGSKIWYQIQGSSPNRVWVLEYFKMNFNGQGTTYYCTAQIRVYETTNTIEICYDTSNQNWGSSIYSASIGIENNGGTVGIDATGSSPNNSTCPTTNYRFTYNSTSQDDSSQAVSLPFAFQFYGNSYSTVNVSTNGFVSFGATGLTNPANDAIPSTNAPDNYIALFWDDLVIASNGVADKVQYRTLGSSPNRDFVIEYYYVTRSGQTSSELTGQIHLYETSHRIELQYATGSANAWTGVTATIGIEDSTGSSGYGGPGTGNTISTCPTSNYRFDVDWTLQVSSAQGTPTPAVGSHTYAYGNSVTCSVTSPASGGSGVQYVCTGWTGTGDVPSSGTGTSTTFTVTQNSTITWNWGTQYQLTLVASPSAGGTVASNQASSWINSGTSVTITATPNAGYLFVNWTGGQSSTANPHTFNMTGAMTITGNFGLSQVTLTVAATPAPYGTANPAYGNTTYNWGTSVTASVTSPVAGTSGTQYVCTGWTGTGDVSSSGTGTSTTFTITQNSTVTWIWLTQYQLSTSVSPSTGGSISTSPSGTWINANATVTATANPAAGYQFSSWSGALTSANNPDTFTMTGPLSLAATFTPIQLTLTVASAWGSPSPAVGSAVYSYGTSITCSVSSPASGPSGTRYVCTGWTGTGDVPASGTALSVSITLTQVSTITWNWSTEFQLALQESPAGSGTVSASPAGPWVAAGTPVTVSATAASPYHFVNWSGPLASTLNPDTFTMSAPCTATGNFQPNGPSITVGSAYGAPNPVVGATSYFAGTQVICSVASPVDGPAGVQYVCTGFTGTGDVPSSGSTNSVSITLNNNSTITWTWGTEYGLAAAESPSGAGTVSSNPAGPWFASGTSILVSAVPGSGSEFLSWSGSLQATDNPAVLVMDGPKSVTANFLGPSGFGVSAGPANPRDSTEGASAQAVPALQVALRAGSAQAVRVSTVTLWVTGSSNEAATVSGVRLFLDADGDGAFGGAETEVGAAQVVSGDDGSATFSASPAVRVPAGGTVYLLAVLNLNASPGDTFQAGISGPGDLAAVLDSSDAPVSAVGLPVCGGTQTVVAAGSPGSVELSLGPGSPAWRIVRPGTSGVPALQFLARASSVENATIASIGISALGGGNDASGIAGAALYQDSDGDGALGAADPLLGQGTYAADDGAVSFGGLGIALAAGAPPQAFLLVVDVSAAARGDFRFGIANAADVSATGQSSAASLAPAGPPFWCAGICAEPVALEPVYFIGACGGGTGGGWALPLAFLAAGLILARALPRRPRAKS